MSESELVNPSQLSTKLEAILYLKAQPLSIQELAVYAICEEEEVEEALLILMQDYALRNSALEVVEGNSGFSLQLREAYMSLVQTIVPTDLGIGALRTLAAIALKGPIPQTQLVELRGSGAYQHVGDLAEEGFVSKRRQSNGRSYSVQVTEKFYQYFEVDELPKLKLKKTVRQRRVSEDDAKPTDVDSQPQTESDIAEPLEQDLAQAQEETDTISPDQGHAEEPATPSEQVLGSSDESNNAAASEPADLLEEKAVTSEHISEARENPPEIPTEKNIEIEESTIADQPKPAVAEFQQDIGEQEAPKSSEEDRPASSDEATSELPPLAESQPVDV